MSNGPELMKLCMSSQAPFALERGQVNSRGQATIQLHMSGRQLWKAFIDSYGLAPVAH